MECHGIVFSWLCPLDCRPPPTRTRSTLTRVRLAVSGLGGCFCQQSFNERKWNTSPCPLPPSLAQLSVVAGLIGFQPPVSSHQVEMQLRLCFGNYVIIRADYCLAVAFVYKRDERWTHRPDCRCTFLFNLFFTRKILRTTYILNKCSLHMKWVDRFFVGLAPTSPVGTSIDLYTSVDGKILCNFRWEIWKWDITLRLTFYPKYGI